VSRIPKLKIDKKTRQNTYIRIYVRTAADVHNEGAGDGWDVDPISREILDLQTLVVRSLEELGGGVSFSPGKQIHRYVRG
jgi:hypothetical protein